MVFTISVFRIWFLQTFSYNNTRMPSSDLSEEPSCSICLDTYTDPVSLQCGHNFCQSCIKAVLDSQERSGVYTCPECRAEYLDRPQLDKNRKLCNIEQCCLLVHLGQEKGKILCTYCDYAEPAVKICLQCETYFCCKHLSHHNKSVDHFLINTTTFPKNLQCSTHHKMLKYYCFEDEACVCVSCFALGEHRGHLVQPIYEASDNKTKEMRHILETLTSKKGETDKCLQTMRNHVEKVQKNADSITKRVNGLFEDIQEQLDSLKKRVLVELNRQTEEIRSQVSDLIKQMEIKLDKLTQSINCIEDICNDTDPFSILQGQKPTRDVFETVNRADKTSHLIGDLNEGLVLNILHTSLFDIMNGIKKYIHEWDGSPLLMDARTAHNKMTLSVDLNTVADSDINHGRPKSPLRFTVYNQVLSLNGFTAGQHYWEVETSIIGIWDIGLAYPSIERNGKRSGIGDNDKSWCLRKYTKNYMAAHNSKAHSLLHEQCSQVIGIYLDYEAGRLSFYELFQPSKCLYRHIHTFLATFTEPLHAAVYVDDGAWVAFKHK
ncbi:E3 ubiquitin-protein ligase TRIM39-like [Mantella aurantiaca]